MQQPRLTGIKDKNGIEIVEGHVVERVGLTRTPMRFVVFHDETVSEETRWRLDSTGERKALVYPWLPTFSRSQTFEVVGSYNGDPSILEMG